MPDRSQVSYFIIGGIFIAVIAAFLLYVSDVLVSSSFDSDRNMGDARADEADALRICAEQCIQTIIHESLAYGIYATSFAVSFRTDECIQEYCALDYMNISFDSAFPVINSDFPDDMLEMIVYYPMMIKIGNKTIRMQEFRTSYPLYSNYSLPLDSSGRLSMDYTIISPEGNLELFFQKGTQVLDQSGNIVNSISIYLDDVTTSLQFKNSISPFIYRFAPENMTLTKDATLRLSHGYDPYDDLAIAVPDIFNYTPITEHPNYHYFGPYLPADFDYSLPDFYDYQRIISSHFSGQTAETDVTELEPFFLVIHKNGTNLSAYYYEDYYYATDQNLRGKAIDEGYVQQNIDGYVLRYEKPGTIPLIELYDDKAKRHYYLTDIYEAAMMEATTPYRYNGIVGYIYEDPDPSAGLIPLVQLKSVDRMTHLTIRHNEIESAKQKTQQLYKEAFSAFFSGDELEEFSRNLLYADSKKASDMVLRLDLEGHAEDFLSRNITSNESRALHYDGLKGFVFAVSELDTYPLYRLYKKEGYVWFGLNDSIDKHVYQWENTSINYTDIPPQTLHLDEADIDPEIFEMIKGSTITGFVLSEQVAKAGVMFATAIATKSLAGHLDGALGEKVEKTFDMFSGATLGEKFAASKVGQALGVSDRIGRSMGMAAVGALGGFAFGGPIGAAVGAVAGALGDAIGKAAESVADMVGGFFGGSSDKKGAASRSYSNDAARESATADADAANTGSCFVAGTRVKLFNGSWKNIEDIGIGEYLLGMNNSKNRVVALERPIIGSRDVCVVNERIIATDEHPFLHIDGSWRACNRLWSKLDHINQSIMKIGDILVTENGTEIVESIRLIKRPYNETVYTFDLDNTETFIAEGFVVHNEGASGGGCGDEGEGSGTA